MNELNNHNEIEIFKDFQNKEGYWIIYNLGGKRKGKFINKGFIGKDLSEKIQEAEINGKKIVLKTTDYDGAIRGHPPVNKNTLKRLKNSIREYLPQAKIDLK